MTGGTADGKDNGEFRPFPVEALPAKVGAFVKEGAAALGCDPAMVALPALAVLAGVIGNKRRIRLKESWTEPATLWTVVAAESGTLKSPAVRLAVQHLYDVQRRLKAEHRRAADAWEEGGEEGARPTLRRVVCGDVTIEKLASLLEENPNGLLLTRDELATWFHSFTRYQKSAGASDVPNWLELHGAGQLMIDRKTGDRTTVIVGNAAVSVTGSIQPSALARVLTPDMIECGLAARLLLAMPPERRKKWSRLVIDPATATGYEDTIDGLLALGAAEDAETGGPKPIVLSLTEEAQAKWVAFYDAWAETQAETEGALRACLAKLEGAAARLALVHHVTTLVAAGKEDVQPVSLASVEAGVHLCLWFAAEARRVYGALAESDWQRGLRLLEEYVARRGGKCSVREVQRSNNRRYPTAAIAEAAMAALVQTGRWRWVEYEPLHGGEAVRCVERVHDA